MACNLDSRLGQLEEQGKTMVDAKVTGDSECCEGYR